MPITTKSGRLIHLNSAEEEARINAGIAADLDSPELTDDFFKNAKPAADVLGADAVAKLAVAGKHRGRPRGSTAEQTKVQINLRVDPDVLAALRGTGTGWQTRVNDLLRREFVHGK